MRWTEYWRTVLGDVGQGSSDGLKRLISRIPAQAIHWRVGLLLMWIGRGAALLVAAIGKRAYLAKGDWRWLAILLALWGVELAIAAYS